MLICACVFRKILISWIVVFLDKFQPHFNGLTMGYIFGLYQISLFFSSGLSTPTMSAWFDFLPFLPSFLPPSIPSCVSFLTLVPVPGDREEELYSVKCFSDLSQFTDSEPLEWKGGQVTLRKNEATLPTFRLSIFHSIFQNGNCRIFHLESTGETEISRFRGISIHLLWIDNNPREPQMSLCSTTRGQAINGVVAQVCL